MGSQCDNTRMSQREFKYYLRTSIKCVPLVIRLCFGKLVTLILQSISIISYASGLMNTSPGYIVLAYLLYLLLLHTVLQE